MSKIVSLTQPQERAGSIEVADLIVSHLANIGIEYVFGVPGGAVEPLYDALARAMPHGGPTPVVTRHESGAAFMADGYARETGKIGVCVSTSGPGATNLITGVACAYDNGVPLLVITGQPPLPSFGKRALQESSCTGINTVGMFRYCTRYNSLVSHPDQVENKLVSALMRAAQMPQGPSHLSIPVDVLRSSTRQFASPYDLRSLLSRKSGLVDETAVRELSKGIRNAQDMVFLIGGGCGDAIEPILELVNMTGSLFVTTPDGKGLINPRHKSYRGVFGFAGHSTAAELLRNEPDLVLAFGTTLGEWNSGNSCETVLNGRLVHIDSCEENLMRTPMARLHVRGRIRSVCERLIELLRADTGNIRAVKKEKNVDPCPLESMLEAPDKFHSDDAPIKPQRLMLELSKRCPPNTRFLADSGNSTAWAVHYLQPQDRRVVVRLHDRAAESTDDRRSGNGSWLRVTMEFAPMGWAIGASVGIARGNPSCPVVCITGDGSYLMNGQEITVAAAEKLPVLFVVLNDGALGMVKHGQRLSGAQPIGYQLPQVDFRRLAEAMGIPGYVIRAPEDLDMLDFEAILRRKGPTMLDVRIDAEEVPPMSLRMKALEAVK